MADSVQAEQCPIEGCDDLATETVEYEQMVATLCTEHAEMARDDTEFEL